MIRQSTACFCLIFTQITLTFSIKKIKICIDINYIYIYELYILLYYTRWWRHLARFIVLNIYIYICMCIYFVYTTCTYIMSSTLKICYLMTIYIYLMKKIRLIFLWYSAQTCGGISQIFHVSCSTKKLPQFQTLA